MSDERKLRMSVELMDTLCTRDHEGNRLRVEWGEPDADGFYTPTIHVDYEDNPLRKRLEAAEKMAKEVARRCPSDGCEAHTLLAALAAGESEG